MFYINLIKYLILSVFLACYYSFLNVTAKLCFRSRQSEVILGRGTQNQCRPGQLSRYSYSLRPGRSGDRIPVAARFSAPVQTDCGAHPASYTKGTESFPGVKRPGHGVDHSPHLAPRLKEEQTYTSTPLWAFVPWVTFTFFTLHRISESLKRVHHTRNFEKH